MKTAILAAIALLSVASCAKENTVTDPTSDQVAATFTSAAITRVAGESWVNGDQIGITMVKNTEYALTDGNYENVPYNVDENATGIFTADDDVIYFPVDGSKVDFIAYYPCAADTDVDADKNISISVADQDYAHIDVVAAKAIGKTKSSPTVTFANDETAQIYEAFSHQLSKLSLTIKVSDGIDDLDGLVTTIKGQYTTAKFNIYSFEFSDKGGLIDNNSDPIDIEMTTPTYNTDKTEAYTSAILIPTDAITGSTIEFAVGGNVYILDSSAIAFASGTENIYTITLKRTGATISGATISNWGDGTEVGNGELDASDLK